MKKRNYSQLNNRTIKYQQLSTRDTQNNMSQLITKECMKGYGINYKPREGGIAINKSIGMC